MKEYPLKIEQQTASNFCATTRAAKNGRPISIGRTIATQNTSTSDAIRIWNLAPDSLTNSKTVYIAKDQIKNFIKSLPI